MPLGSASTIEPMDSTGAGRSSRPDPCSEMMFRCPFWATDMQFKCADGELVSAHKHVLAARCKYYHQRFFENNNDSEVQTKHLYSFAASSACCQAMLQYMYGGCIVELETRDCDMELYLPFVAELLRMASTPRKFGLAGLDRYLKAKLCQHQPKTATQALQRLRAISDIRNCQELIEHIMASMADLDFYVSAFKEACIEPALLAIVLQKVPLRAPEFDVCRAVALWAQEYYLYNDDDDEDEDEQPEVFELSRDILDAIDLQCLSPQQIHEELPALRIFPMDMLREVKRNILLDDLSKHEARQNIHRGRDLNPVDIGSLLSSWRTLDMEEASQSARLGSQTLTLMSQTSQLGSQVSQQVSQTSQQVGTQSLRLSSQGSQVLTASLAALTLKPTTSQSLW